MPINIVTDAKSIKRAIVVSYNKLRNLYEYGEKDMTSRGIYVNIVYEDPLYIGQIFGNMKTQVTVHQIGTCALHSILFS